MSAATTAAAIAAISSATVAMNANQAHGSVPPEVLIKIFMTIYIMFFIGYISGVIVDFIHYKNYHKSVNRVINSLWVDSWLSNDYSYTIKLIFLGINVIYILGFIFNFIYNKL